MRGPVESPHCASCPMAVDGKPNKPVRGIGPGPGDANGHPAPRPDFIVVGMEPGANEVRTGEPFVGASGRLLDKALHAVGVARERLYVTNAALCWVQGSSDEAREDARLCCKPRLQAELEAFAPDIPILALGAAAAKSLLESHLDKEMMSMGKIMGTSHDFPLGETTRTAITSIHPAAILRGGDEGGLDMAYWRLLYDIRKAKKLGAGDPDTRLALNVQYAIDPDECRALLDGIIPELHAAGGFGIDFETRLRPEAPYYLQRLEESVPAFWSEITAIGLSTAERGISVAWGSLDAYCKARVRALLASGLRKRIQNRIYDRCVGAVNGVPIAEPCDDLLLAHHAAFPGMRHDLQNIVSMWWVVPPWKSEFRAGKGTPGELLDYNAKDSLSTEATFPRVAICVKQTRAERAYQMDLRMAALAEQMHLRGMPVDKEVNAELEAKFRADIKTATAHFQGMFKDAAFLGKFTTILAREQAKVQRKGEPPDYEQRIEIRRKEAVERGWNHKCPATKTATSDGKDIRVKLGDSCPRCENPISFGSNNHVVAYLKAHGAKMYVTTDKGRISTKGTVLDTFIHIDGVRPILDRREAHKLLSTFVLPAIQLVDHHGRVHVIWSVHKITGRFGSEAINVQNWAKSNPKGRPNLRRMIVAPKGRVFIGMDKSQLEARIHALLSGDAFLCKIFIDAESCEVCKKKPPGKFCNDHDIHRVFCREVWSDYLSFSVEQQEKLRDEIKQPEYGCMYGASDGTMHQAMLKYHPKIQLASVSFMANIIRQKLVGVNAWHEDLLRQVIREGEIRTLLTERRRCFPLGNASPNEVWNYPVQGTGADIMGVEVCNLQEHLDPELDWIIQQGHDSLLIETDEDRADFVAGHGRRELDTEYTHNGVTIRFPTTVKVGKSWAEVT